MSKSTIYAPDTTLASDDHKVGELLALSRGNNGAMLDSASAAVVNVVGEAIKNPADLLPARMVKLLDKIEAKSQPAAVCAMLDGIKRFEHEHGFTPTADMIDAAISQGMSLADGSAPILPGGMTLDSASSSMQSSPLSHQPNRINVALVMGIAEALPFGAYLSADISSNESLLAIINSAAGTDFGAYKDGDIMDGISSGKSYINPERIQKVVLSADRTTATFAFKTTDAGNGQAIPVVPTRTRVIIGGFTVAAEIDKNAKTASRQIAGNVNIKGADHGIVGTVKFADGTGALTFSPALPEDTVVSVSGFVDYEAKPSLIPAIKTEATSWSLYCTEQRVLMQVTPGSRSQGQNELGTDFLTVAVNAARRQMANERFYTALGKVRAVAENTSKTFDFDAANQLLQKSRAQRWRDFAAFFGEVSQLVAITTMEYGLSMLFVGTKGASNFRTMGSDDFQPSGIEERPGVYRVGRYKGKVDVYYTPYHITETDTEIEMIGIGRAQQVARNPIVLSDALAPTMIPLGVGTDLKAGAALYTRNMTEVNPHTPSAMGCALIRVSNIDLLAV
ncbi:hypothetical protein [Pseudomonas viridiflava]|uniref:hypothetical protein n=1 Tax=Pseudomonas viridiflava TaxID=33069 RepID=UPI000F030B21|nr:hypothetical protein [Pseudomonas viridiflava]